MVFDSVLEQTQLEELRHDILDSSWKAVHSDFWQRVWRLRKETAWEGQRAWGLTAPEHQNGVEFVGSPGLPRSVCRVYEAILGANASAWKIVGKPGEIWDRINSCPYLYGADSGLPWHSDNEFYSGAFIFYAHQDWNIGWGGELLISSSRLQENLTFNSGKRGLFVGFKDTDLSLGHYLLPIPNRLVILAAGYPHAIQPVEPIAGDRTRETISGFFLKKEDRE